MLNEHGIITKNKKRVRDYGEVFTPKKIVNDILDMPRMDKASSAIGTKFLEPAAGEGAFLVEILRRKLKTVVRDQAPSLIGVENYSLFALSTLYGIELLEDNAQLCVMNLFEVYFKFYQKEALKYGKNIKDNVLQSAKFIISKNIVQGDFLKRVASDGQPIVFTEWQIVNLRKGNKKLFVKPKEYTLDEIFNIAASESPHPSANGQEDYHQVSIFEDDLEVQPKTLLRPKHIPITKVYKEVEINGSNCDQAI